LIAGPLVSAIAQPSFVTMDQLLGINTRGSDPVRFLRGFNHVREYHQWNDDVGDAASSQAVCPEDFNPASGAFLRYRFNPSLNNAALIYYDDFYNQLYQRAVPVLKGLAPQMRGYNGYPLFAPQLLDQKAVCLTGPYQWLGQGTPPPVYLMPSNQSVPALYRSHALWATLFTARYGSNAFAATSLYSTNFLQPHLITQPSQSAYDDLVERWPRRTGLDAIRYIENNNEPEKSWYDTYASIQEGQGNTFWQMTASQYAAQLSADYDGHGRSAAFKITGLNDSSAWLGIKNVDPAMRVVMAGPADFRGRYVEDIIAWCRANRTPGVHGFWRGDLLPFDVVNFHHYSTQFSANDNGLYNSLAERYHDIKKAPIEGPAITPEADNLRGEILYTAQRLETAEPSLAGKEFWLSEFGYDSQGANSAIRVPAVPGQDGQKTQAQWLVRSVLEIAATRRVSKAMLYELRDEPGLYSSTFGYSGLITADLRPKRAWYYVQTLQNVLHGYYCDPQAPPTALVSPDVVQIVSSDPAAQQTRVLKFSRSDGGVVYALWSPTGSAVSYTASLVFAHSVQFSQASLVEFAEMDEDGQWSNRTQQIVPGPGGLRVDGLPIGESPVFLVLGQGRHDLPAPPLTGLTAQATCCDAVQLSWQPHPDHHFYRVFYGKVSEVGTAVPFDFTHAGWKLHELELGGQASGTLVAGLTGGQAYRFFVVPVDDKGRMPAGWASAPVYAVATPGNCAAGSANCLIDIQASQLSYGYGLVPTAVVRELLGANNQVNTCSEIAPGATSTNNWDDWDWMENDPLARAITIDLQQSYTLSSINLLDSYGKGQLLFEYKNCACDQWQPFQIVTLNVDFDRWMYVPVQRTMPVRYLRVSKLDPDAKIRKLFFCGAPVSCDPAQQAFQPGALTDLEAPFIRDNSARLRWTALPYNTAYPQLGYSPAYRIRYASQWTPGGQLIDPLEAHAIPGAWEKTVYYELTNLAPGVTYRAEVKPEAGTPACSGPTSGQWIEFTTARGEVVYRDAPPREMPAQAAGMAVQPNPASERVALLAPRAGYQRLEVVQAATGAVQQDHVLDSALTSWSLDVSALPPGLYVLRLRGAGLPDQVGKLVVLR
jgi:hypothetical protein